eukprot:1365185-Rhodomonas_salina.3
MRALIQWVLTGVWDAGRGIRLEGLAGGCGVRPGWLHVQRDQQRGLEYGQPTRPELTLLLSPDLLHPFATT